jgi:hypothetical protein
MSDKKLIKISEERIRQIISEEISALGENVDHNAIVDVVTPASKFLKAAVEFKEKMNGSLENVCSPALDSLIKKLQGVLETPGAYVDRVPVLPKTIRLRQTGEKE